MREGGAMRKPVIVVCLFALTLLAGCVTTGKGVDNAVPIRPVVDPGARKAALAQLPPAERSRYCQSYAGARQASRVWVWHGNRKSLI